LHSSIAPSLFPTSQASTPDPTLLALCQFTATRLDARVVGVSLLGRLDQYILAQSTQTLELDGAETDTESEDAAWLAICQTVDIASKRAHCGRGHFA